jgi:hypothetical protein
MMEQLTLNALPENLDRCLRYWHRDPADFRPSDLEINPTALLLAYKNYLLWHEEDKARRTDVADGDIARVKRSIDQFNQQRNDLIEQLDIEILAWLEGERHCFASKETNSETPGSIVDRISILSLKIYHMEEDAQRTDIDADHQGRSEQKCAVLRLQRADLFAALGTLVADYLAGRKVMRLYKQFKMYNDPALNPELYKKRSE